ARLLRERRPRSHRTRRARAPAPPPHRPLGRGLRRRRRAPRRRRRMGPHRHDLRARRRRLDHLAEPDRPLALRLGHPPRSRRPLPRVPLRRGLRVLIDYGGGTASTAIIPLPLHVTTTCVAPGVKTTCPGLLQPG